jgi:GDP-L-fucose synthase
MTDGMDLSNKRIVVTGGAGFLGQAVIEVLEARGATDVFVPRSATYDLRDRRAIERLFDDARPQVILHLAAVVGGIGANRENPGKFFYENLIMGVELLEVARLRGIDKFVTVGTICAYPKHTPVPFREEDLWDGYPEETNAPYGIAKKALLVQGQAYRQQYGMNIVYLLPVNLYGPRDNFDLQTSHVIPALIRKCLEARDAGVDVLDVWGDGSPSREFLHVRDAAQGIVLAAEAYDGADPVNLGTGREITIRALVGLIAQATGFKGALNWQTDKPNGQLRRCLDTARARERFGFQAAISLEEGIAETVTWFEATRAQEGLDPLEHAI